MANNLLSMLKVENKVHRSAFDLSYRNVLSADFGMLVPFDVREVVPGDNVSINASSFSRTVPLNSASFTRFREHMDYYFVPYRLLWRFSDAALVKMPNNNSALTSMPTRGEECKELPYFSDLSIKKYLTFLSSLATGSGPNKTKYCDDGGLPYRFSTERLLEYLGYGYRYDNSDNPELDIPDCTAFRALAYQKIYADFYRNDQWEDLVPYAYNCDYLQLNADSLDVPLYQNASSGFTAVNYSPLIMRYANYPKDIVTGVLPNSQYGGSVYVDVKNNLKVDDLNIKSFEFDVDGRQSIIDPLGVGSNSQLSSNNEGVTSVTANVSKVTNDPSSVRTVYNRFNVLALRQAQALQKYREITECHKKDYKHQIKAHYDVNVSDDRSDTCKYLCGNVSSMDLTSVTNTNFDNGSDPTIKGNLSSSNGCSCDNFIVREHGIIMGIYYAEPIIDYGDSVSPTLLNVDIESQFQPEFDKLGFEPVSAYAVADAAYASEYTTANGTPTIGYLPRYWQYKLVQDRVQDNALISFPSWTSRITLHDLNVNDPGDGDGGSQFYSMTYRSFKVCPFHANGVFSQLAPNFQNPVENYSTRILINFSNNCVMVRPMDEKGMPY
nr:MAG TPA: Major capsid protein [Microviridae sp.]